MMSSPLLPGSWCLPSPNRQFYIAPLVRFDGVGEGSEALDLDRHLISCLQPHLRVAGRADAWWGACDYDIAGDEGHALGEEGDELGDREDHLRCRTVLHDLAVEDAPDRKVLRVFDLVTGRDVRPHRAEGVYGLAARPLSTLGELEVARGDVVGVRVAEDVTWGLGLGDVAGCPPDNEGELVLVVEANTDNLLGSRYRGMDARLPERHRIFAWLRTPAVLDKLDHVLVGEGPYLFALQRPDTRLPTIHRIREQFQGLSSLRTETQRY